MVCGVSEINALRIWERLAGACGEAVDFYSEHFDKDAVLKKGAANFDEKCKPNDAREHAHYRTDYYVSRNGYMDMHIKHNLAAFQYCFKDGIPQPILFVDFGCGPMTSGLALAEILSKQTSNYRTQTTYFGVDASRNMVNKANYINKQHGLFASERFKIVHGTQFDSQNIPYSFPKTQTAVLCLPFVLAPDTLKSESPGACTKSIAWRLADAWKKYVENQPGCRDVRIIYLNPKSSKEHSLHNNWSIFKAEMLRSTTARKFCYTAGKHVPLRVESLGREISLQTILGTRK